MLYQKFSPCTQPAPFIETYFIWTSQSDRLSNPVVGSPPNGSCSIVFNTGDAYVLKKRSCSRHLFWSYPVTTYLSRIISDHAATRIVEHNSMRYVNDLPNNVLMPRRNFER